LLILAAPALARDNGQYGATSPEMKAWFESLKSRKGPCCAYADGRVIADTDWESRGGRYRVRVPRTDPNYGMASDPVWVDVPDEALITTPNMIGRTMVWPVWLAGADVMIRCFMPGQHDVRG
jgi:hypothetical protein